MRLQRVKKIVYSLIAAATLGGWFGNCHRSCVKIDAGLESRKLRVRSLAYVISTRKLDPDCLVNNKRLKRRLTPLLGEENSSRFLEATKANLEKLEDPKFMKEAEESGVDPNLDLASFTDEMLTYTVGSNSSSAERAERVLILMTAPQPGRPSTLGSSSSMFGEKTAMCENILVEECGRDQ